MFSQDATSPTGRTEYAHTKTDDHLHLHPQCERKWLSLLSFYTVLIQIPLAAVSLIHSPTHQPLTEPHYKSLASLNKQLPRAVGESWEGKQASNQEMWLNKSAT